MQCRSLFLHTTGVGNDQAAARRQVEETAVVKGLSQVDPVIIPQNFLRHRQDVEVGHHRIYQVHVRISLDNVFHRVENLPHRFTNAFRACHR